MRCPRPLPIAACLGVVMMTTGCVYEHRDGAYRSTSSPPHHQPVETFSSGIGLEKEVKASLKMAFSKAVEAPEGYRIRRYSLYRFEQKIRYRIEIAGSDGSIWRATVEKPETIFHITPDNETVKLPGQDFEVSIRKVVEPVAIFRPYASARKKGQLETEEIE